MRESVRRSCAVESQVRSDDTRWDKIYTRVSIFTYTYMTCAAESQIVHAGPSAASEVAERRPMKPASMSESSGPLV